MVTHLQNRLQFGCGWASLLPQTVKTPPAMRETWVWSLGREDPLKEGMATHSSILAWRISIKEEPGGLQSMGSQRVGHDWATNTFIFFTWLGVEGGWGWKVQSNPSFSLVLGPFPIKEGQSPSRTGMGVCGGCQSFPGAAALCLQSNTQERAGKSLDKIRNWSWPWR